jgi:hypothetical protein
MDPTGTPSALHDERLWPSPGTWLVVPLLGLGVAVSLLPVGAVAAAVATVVVLAVVVTGLVLASAPVRVADGELVAGPARIPVALLGAAEPLREAEARHARGPGLDARAFLLVRGWVQPMVRVPVLDDQDPTPYWLVSTRRPEELAHAIDAARGQGRTARGHDDAPPPGRGDGA